MKPQNILSQYETTCYYCKCPIDMLQHVKTKKWSAYDFIDGEFKSHFLRCKGDEKRAEVKQRRAEYGIVSRIHAELDRGFAIAVAKED